MESSETIVSSASAEREKKKARDVVASLNDAAEKSAHDAEGDDVGPKTATRQLPMPLKPVELISSRIKVKPRDKVEVSIRTLLEAGVHFGHQTSRWNPAMATNIHSTRNGIHIVNLPKTLQAWQVARKAIVDVMSEGGTALFVGTKKQAHDAIMEEAVRCGAFYVTQRWLGGMITNFQTIRKSIERMRKIESTLQEEESLAQSGQSSKFTKKERLLMQKDLQKLDYSLGGIRDMQAPPQLIFVVDIRREEISVREAMRANIPVVALVDTNCDPANVNFPIPSNDDGTRAIRLFAAAVADAVLEGKQIHSQKPREVREPKRKGRGGNSRRAANAEAGAAAEADSSASVEATDSGSEEKETERKLDA